MTKVFEITDKSLKVKNSNLLESIERDILFDEITDKYIHKQFVSTPLVCLTALFALLSLKEAISIYFSKEAVIPLDYLAAYLMVTILLSMFTLLKKNQITYLILSNGMRVDMYSNKPSKIIVNDFLEVLRFEKSAYLTKKHNLK